VLPSERQVEIKQEQSLKDEDSSTFSDSLNERNDDES
jgi:hypothetical protein